MVSQLSLVEDKRAKDVLDGTTINRDNLEQGFKVEVEHAHGEKCDRCWKYDEHLEDGLCERCRNVIK